MRRNIKINIIALVLSLGLFASCSEFLDVKPVGKLIPTEIEEFDNLLNNTNTIAWNYTDNNNGSRAISLTDNIIISDEVITYEYSPQHVNIDRMAAYIFNQPYQEPDMPDYYLSWGVYRSAGIYNNVIDGVRGIEGAEETIQGKNTIAKAMAARAWTMMHAAISYGPMYEPNGTNDTPVLPYRTDGDPSVAVGDRNTTAEMFEMAKADLEYAIANAPEDVASAAHASKTASKALLAQLYMYQGDWNNMYTYAKDAWNSALAKGGINALIYDYNTELEYVYTTPLPVPSRPEIDVRTELLIKSSDNAHLKAYCKEALFFRTSPSRINTGRPSPEYLALFEDGDKRKEMFIMKDGGYLKTLSGAGAGGADIVVDEGVNDYDLRVEKLRTNSGLSYPILLLMYAEAAARTGKDGEAMQLLNDFRKFRYTAATATLPTLTGDALTGEILTERRRENPVNSLHRFWDMKRFAKEDASKPWVKKEMSRVVKGETLKADINGDKYIFVIINTYIKNNPSWGLPLITDYNPYPYPSAI